ncbi:MAG: hypothetical protein JRN52_13170, partial [Nitrososphaerota archaeon]|nr:hypothetical protein [Nitrososphaerota archaeon]
MSNVLDGRNGNLLVSTQKMDRSAKDKSHAVRNGLLYGIPFLAGLNGITVQIFGLHLRPDTAE